jgi:hypothetical protein
MRKRTFFLLLAALLLFSTLPLLSIEPTKAAEAAVYIHADGSVEGTGSIMRNGDYILSLQTLLERSMSRKIT